MPAAVPLPEPGTRVRVPFGERVLTGVVVGSAGEVPGRRTLREILEVLDDEPVCPPDLLATAERVAQRFFASTGEVLKSALPARLPASGAVRYRITDRGALAGAAAAPEERAILDRLAGGEALRVRDLPRRGAARRPVLRALEEKGWVRAAGAPRRIARRRELVVRGRPRGAATRPTGRSGGVRADAP